MSQNSILSFCIPTFNRANRVYECVSHILKYEGNDIEVIVSDNHSTDATCEILKKINDTRFRYHKNNSNLGYTKNFLKVLELSNAPFIFTISDEDLVNIDLIPKIINILKSNKDLAILTGCMQVSSSGKYYHSFGNAIYKKGSKALLKFAFRKNYLSGAIYNKKLINFDKIYSEIDLCTVYPQLYLEALLCQKGNLHTISDTICFMGKQEKDNNMDLIKGHVYYEYEARIYKHDDFVEILKRLETDSTTKKLLYKFICHKLIYGITLLKSVKNSSSTEVLDKLSAAKQHAINKISEITNKKSDITEIKNYIDFEFNRFKPKHL